ILPPIQSSTSERL
ncbi:unnamed protein product, partial [Rotaria sordida]